MPFSPLDYQKPGVDHLTRILPRQKCLIDASQPGYGKTYVSLFVAKAYNLRPLIVAPKSVLPAWEDAIHGVGVIPRDILNYEQVRTGKTPWMTWEKKKRYAHWHLPAGTFLIMDEAHRYRGEWTLNSKMLIGARYAMEANHSRMILLSATLAEGPLQMRSIGYALGLFDDINYWHGWSMQHGAYKGKFRWDMRKGSEDKLVRIHKAIFPKCGIAYRTDNLPGFPKTTIATMELPMASRESIQEGMKLMDQSRSKDQANADAKALRELKEEMEDAGWDMSDIGGGATGEVEPITELLRLRQETELRLVPELANRIQRTFKQGKSPVVFLNFRVAMDELQKRINRPMGLIDGSVTGSDRRELLDKFQVNSLDGMMIQSQAGGEGISAHDLSGRPRETFISPPFSAINYIQILGRCPRAGALSDTHQNILVGEGSTLEAKIFKTLQQRINHMNLINYGAAA